jgi:DsbC/DsbD-like thiol-disulfide interchange protein
MTNKNFRAVLLCLVIALLLPATSVAKTRSMDSSEVKTRGEFSFDKAQRGKAIQAAVVIEIPDGYHVNSNQPLGKYAIPTQLKIEAPNGIRVTPVTYPRSAVRTFKFSDEKLSVYEGRTVLRFVLIVPASFKGDSADLHAKLRFQSCTNEVCFAPETRDLPMSIKVVEPTEPVQNANSGTFGRARR